MRLGLYIVAATLAALVVIGCGSEVGRRQLRAGVEALEDREYVLAKTWFENTISETTDPAIKMKAYNYLGVASWRLNEIRDAQAAFESAREIDPKFTDALVNLGLIAFETGSNRRAIAMLEEAVMLDSSDTRALECLGRAYMRDRRWADARRIFLEALEHDPESARLLTSAGLTEFSLTRYRDAADYWQKALKAEPDYAPAIFNLAALKIRIDGDRAQGEELLGRFIGIVGPDERKGQIKALRATTAVEQPPGPDRRAPEPRDDEPKDALESAREKRRTDGSALALNMCLQEAIRAKRVGDEMRQLEALQTAAQICFDQARAHYALGRFYLERGNTEKATRALRQAVAISPDWATAQIAFAECSVMDENYDAALVSLRKALEIDNENREALWLLARLYDRHMEDASAALQAYEQFSKLFPGDPRVLKARDRTEMLRGRASSENQPPAETAPGAARSERPGRDPRAAITEFNLGFRAQQEDRWDQAVAHYEKAVALDGQLVRAHFNLGVARAVVGEEDRAVQAYRKTLELQPQHLSARFNLALIYYNSGRYSHSIRELETILSREPDHAKAHFLLGVIYANDVEDIQKAKHHYRRFLQIEPGDRNAPIVREWIGRH